MGVQIDSVLWLERNSPKCYIWPCRRARTGWTYPILQSTICLYGLYDEKTKYNVQNVS